MRALVVFGIWFAVWLTAFLPPAMAKDFSKSGPFAVGVQGFSIDDATGLHPLKGLIWYPAIGPVPDPAKAPNHGVKNAPVAPGGPFPLVVVIPGLDTIADTYEDWGKLLASHGFVAISANFDFASNAKPDSGPDSMVNRLDATQVRLIYTRPANAMRLIAYADELTTPGGKMAGLIDTSHIGVFGHSSGGTTGLQAAGARIDFQALADWCAANAKTMEIKYGESCAFQGHEPAIARAYGAQDPFAGPLPALWDKRVSALVLGSPGGELHVFGDKGIAAVTVPTLVMFPLDDDIVIPEWNALWAYHGIGSPQKALATFESGGHTMFTGFVREFDGAASLGTAFFLSVLKGDTVATAAMQPGAVSIPGVQYETTLTGP